MTIKRRLVHWISHNLHFFFAGLACIVWFLFRTGTKPSRVEYPCQQASMAGAHLWFAVYLYSLVSLVRPQLNGRDQINLLLVAGVILAIVIIGAWYFFGHQKKNTMLGNRRGSPDKYQFHIFSS